MAQPPDSPMDSVEPALDPDLPICDAHHHLWQRGHQQYLVGDLTMDIASGHNVVSTVAVECGAFYRDRGPDDLKPVGETEFLEEIAIKTRSGSHRVAGIAAAIVGYADLRLGDAVAGVLEAHLTCSSRRFRGIRCATTWDPAAELRSEAPPGLLADRQFRRGLACLQRYGLSYDAWLYHTQLQELAAVARDLPELTIVLDHAGAPLGVGAYASRLQEVYRAWSAGMEVLACCPNVSVKLGGFGSERSGFDWHRRKVPAASAEVARAISPYVEWCIDKFGADRCMFESNFPVEKRANSYLTVWNAFKRITGGCSADERRALFHDTAARIYKIEQAL